MVGGEKALGGLYSSLHLKFGFMQNQAKLDHPEIDHFNYQTYLLVADYSYSFAKFIPHPWYIRCIAVCIWATKVFLLLRFPPWS